MNKWVVKEDTTEDHWLDVIDPEGWYSASVKWDGCIHFRRFHNIPLPETGEHPQSVDYIHYCDLDDEIERLKHLKEMAIKHFGKDWS